MINKTYVINLERRSDKKNQMEKQMLNFSLNHCFFRAIDATNGFSPTDMPNHLIRVENWTDPNTNKAITNGEIGCALSHYKVWSDIIDLVESKQYGSDANFLILEDDVLLPADFGSKLEVYFTEVYNTNLDYDMIYVHRKALDYATEINHSQNIRLANKSYWCCAYILTYNGAKKLVGTNYLSKLIPVDEYLPIMYGCRVFGYEQNYSEYSKIKCYAFPNLLQLVDNAFLDSDTFHTEAYDKKFDNFYIYYVGPTNGDSYARFISFCNIYGINCILLKNLGEVKNHLLEHKKNRLEEIIVMTIITNKNSYPNIVPQMSGRTIYEKFMSIPNAKNIALEPSEHPLNSFIYCTLAINLLEELSNPNFELNNKSDTTCDIFQPISSSSISNIEYQITRSTIKNTKFNKIPCFLFAIDKKSVLNLNSIGNYIGNGWNQYYGQRIKFSPIEVLPKIYLVSECDKNQINLDYPDDLIKYSIFGPDLVSDFLKTDCEYLLTIDKNYIITEPKLVQKLVQTNMNVVAPLMTINGRAWSNFWGSLDPNGYYARSFDYLEILNGNRRGIWNVPYVTGVVLIKRNVLDRIPNLYSMNSSLDLDMRFCLNLRSNDIFMHVLNDQYYGYILENIDSNPNLINSNSVEPLTIYSMSNRIEWEKKYLSSDYLKYRHLLSKITKEVCPDIYLLPLFSEDFCSELVASMEKYGKWSVGGESKLDIRLGPTYVENVPTVDTQLFQIGFDKQWKQIVSDYISPLVRLLYSDYHLKNINLAFVVKYSMDQQKELRPHHDSSTVTVNIALNRGMGIDYSGGGCRFIRQNLSVTDQPIGSCLLHPGRLTAYHEGLPITSGTRYILVSFIN